MIAAVSLIIGFAGFVDAIAGGGGIISLPAYFLTGLPAHVCYGTNKFTAACGTTFAAATYFKNGAMNIKAAVIAAAGSFIGSTIGSRLVMNMEERTLKIMLIVLLPCVAVFIFVKKIGDGVDLSNTLGIKKLIALAFVVGICVGLYDGIFGPGTGTIAAIAFTTVMKFDLKTASGNAKLLNLASNYAALVTFLIGGVVDFRYAIPAAICNIAGNIIGSRLAVKKGAKFIRPIMISMVVLLMISVAYDIVTGV
ncbi:MAG: TSUP family transporter [Firmicutes bacterium]|nr:TSUP family transporter [Bacillota bacterium]